MEALGTALGWLIAAAFAVAGQRAAVHGLRTLLMARDPLCGEHADSRAYHRSLWSTDRPENALALSALVVSGGLVAAGLQTSAWLLVPAELLWLGVLVWDLWTWERAAASVKFVAWRRWPAPLRPGCCSVTLVLRDGKAVKLPRTGTLFGGEAQIEDFANFLRMQMDVVADNRRRAAAEKRAAKRQAMELPPAHPATRLDHQALPTLRAG
jgi:hypothetical protein